ncbi:MAG: hypothetical protein O3A39_04755 [Proteobacteria bacterium]|nr:hypothetical protein [Pseudomonadota bacterium]
MKNTKTKLSDKVNYFLENSYFDIQGLDPTSITENQIARLLTKVTVGSVTVLWSILELRNLIKFRKDLKG